MKQRTGPLWLLLGLCACPATRTPTAPPPKAGPSASLRPGRSRTDPAQWLEAQLAALASPMAHDGTYQWLRQLSQEGDQSAQLVLLVFAIRDAQREGCQDLADRQLFSQQTEELERMLGHATDAEWVFAGPTLLLARVDAAQVSDLPALASRVVEHARAVLATAPQRLAEVLADTSHALRLGCFLREALPQQEEAVRLLTGAQPSSPDGAPPCCAQSSLSAQLARRDLATLRFLLGDAAGAQRTLDELQGQLARESPGAASAGEASLAVRQEIVTVLRTFLVDANGSLAGPSPPRETGPGWQALRAVQEQASCPQASPANPRLLRVPVHALACPRP